jgi:hypothetical protein
MYVRHTEHMGSIRTEGLRAPALSVLVNRLCHAYCCLLQVCLMHVSSTMGSVHTTVRSTTATRWHSCARAPLAYTWMRVAKTALTPVSCYYRHFARIRHAVYFWLWISCFIWAFSWFSPFYSTEWWFRSIYYSLLGYDTIYSFRWVALLPEDGGIVFLKYVGTHLLGTEVKQSDVVVHYRVRIAQTM